MTASSNYESEIDRQICRIQARVDSEQAFRQLFRRFYPALIGFFVRRGFSEEESRDLAQESFIGVFRGIERFRGQVRFEHWLFQIAANVWRNELRRRSTTKRGGKQLAPKIDDPSAERVHDATASKSPNPLRAVLDQERLTMVRSAMRGLPAQMRRCLLLRSTAEMSYREIAETLRLSVPTVKTHLAEGRRRLRLQLSEEFGDLSVFE